MGKTTKRLPQDERREQIIKTAMKIINDEGYAAFTTRRLAKKIGISEPALYRHFANKDDIIVSILMKMEKLWTDLASELEKTEDMEEKICLFIMSHFRYIENNRDILAVLFADEYIRLNAYIRDRLREVTGKRFNYLEKLLNEGIEAGQIKGSNPRSMTMIITGAIRMTALSWRNQNYTFSLSEIGENICINLANMLLYNNK